MTEQHTVPKRTPWGTPQHCQQLAEGIYEVTTASHGGIWVTRARRHAMPHEIRSIPTWTGGHWYEEDCDWALVALAYPEVFNGEVVKSAIATARHFHAEKLDLDAYLETEAGKRVVAAAD